MIRSQCFAQVRSARLSGFLLMAVASLAPALAHAQTPDSPPLPQEYVVKHTHGYATVTQPFPAGDGNGAVRSDDPGLSPRQRRLIMRAHFVALKRDATELAALAKGLREALNDPSTSVLSEECGCRIDRIHKLARKIREETEQY